MPVSLTADLSAARCATRYLRSYRSIKMGVSASVHVWQVVRKQLQSLAWFLQAHMEKQSPAQPVSALVHVYTVKHYLNRKMVPCRKLFQYLSARCGIQYKTSSFLCRFQPWIFFLNWMQLFIIYPWLVVVLFLIFHFFLFFKVFLIFGVSMEVRPVLKTQSQTSCQPLDGSEFLYLRYKA